MVDTDRRRFLGSVVAGAALSATSASAQEKQENESSQQQSGDQEQAEGEDESEGPPDTIRFVHASPDTPAVEVRIEGPEGTVMVHTVDALDTHEQSPEFTPGSVTVRVRSAEDGTLLLRSELELEGGPYTLVLMGESCAIAKRPLQLVPFADDPSPLEEGQVRVRVVHTLPDAPALDVRHGEEQISDDLEFGAADITDRPSGEIPVSISMADGDEEIATFPFDPPEGGSYTLYLIGYLRAANAPEDAAIDGVRLGVTVDRQPTQTIESITVPVTVADSAVR